MLVRTAQGLTIEKGDTVVFLGAGMVRFEVSFLAPSSAYCSAQGLPLQKGDRLFLAHASQVLFEVVEIESGLGLDGTPQSLPSLVLAAATVLAEDANGQPEVVVSGVTRVPTVQGLAPGVLKAPAPAEQVGKFPPDMTVLHGVFKLAPTEQESRSSGNGNRGSGLRTDN